VESAFGVVHSQQRAAGAESGNRDDHCDRHEQYELHRADLLEFRSALDLELDADGRHGADHFSDRISGREFERFFRTDDQQRGIGGRLALLDSEWSNANDAVSEDRPGATERILLIIGNREQQQRVRLLLPSFCAHVVAVLEALRRQEGAFWQ